jgi:hypothetical protein
MLCPCVLQRRTAVLPAAARTAVWLGSGRSVSVPSTRGQMSGCSTGWCGVLWSRPTSWQASSECSGWSLWVGGSSGHGVLMPQVKLLAVMKGWFPCVSEPSKGQCLAMCHEPVFVAACTLCNPQDGCECVCSADAPSHLQHTAGVQPAQP